MPPDDPTGATLRELRDLLGLPPPDAKELVARLLGIVGRLETRIPQQQSPAAQEWPDRLRASASTLIRTSHNLEAILRDDGRFDRNPQAATETLREFNRLLVDALTALTDLTAFDNPEQEYPDLSGGFAFRCSNVVYGQHVDTIVTLPPDERAWETMSDPPSSPV
jgi:hypothetical protein